MLSCRLNEGIGKCGGQHWQTHGDLGYRVGQGGAHAQHVMSVAYISALPLFYEIFVNLHVISYKNYNLRRCKIYVFLYY